MILYSLDKIFSRYPNVKKKYYGEDVLLTNIENTFYQLSMFVTHPKNYSFNIGSLYQYGTEEEILLALKTIEIFFHKDARLISDQSLKSHDEARPEKEDLFNQAMFARYLQKHGLNFTPAKLAVYKKRGKLPSSDLTIQGKPYWYRSSVEYYLKNEFGIKP